MKKLFNLKSDQANHNTNISNIILNDWQNAALLKMNLGSSRNVGERGCGKTTAATVFAIKCVKDQKKVLYIALKCQNSAGLAIYLDNSLTLNEINNTVCDFNGGTIKYTTPESILLSRGYKFDEIILDDVIINLELFNLLAKTFPFAKIHSLFTEK